MVRHQNGGQELIQVCAFLKFPETAARELRALDAAAKPPSPVEFAVHLKLTVGRAQTGFKALSSL